MNRILFIIFLTLLTPAGVSPNSFPAFIRSLYDSNQIKIDAIFNDIYCNGMKKTGAIIECKNNRAKIIPLLFYHMLFTTTDAQDCSRGGILQIPYFWHWVQPNPRYQIIFTPDSIPLSAAKSPVGFEKYKSYADVDRTPTLYYQNLVEISPLFSHPQCGSFYTFGWCSEREMAFNTLMQLLGYTCKIKQEGIHVWSEILATIEFTEGIKRMILIQIDNTFNTIDFQVFRNTKQQWLTDFGNGTQVKWYNKVAHSEKEKNIVANISVPIQSERRILKNVVTWLEQF